jgi:hypothetical protein
MLLLLLLLLYKCNPLNVGCIPAILHCRQCPQPSAGLPRILQRGHHCQPHKPNHLSTPLILLLPLLLLQLLL